MHARPWIRSALIALAVLSGCTTQTGDIDWVHRGALNESQRRYTQLVRWGEIERASHFVDPAMRDDFLAHMAAFEQIRITDFETGGLDVAEDGAVDIAVTYSGYSLASLIERTIRERQHWVRAEDSGQWLVQSNLDDLIKAVSAPAQ